MIRRIAPLVIVVLLLGACADDGADAPATTSPGTTAPTTTVVTSSTSVAPTTPPQGESTTTSMPSREPNPDLAALAGIWTSETITSWSIKFDGFTIVGGGNPTNLVIPGSVDLADGVLSVRGLDLGTGGCGDVVGTYIATRDGNSLTLELVEDGCTRRAETLPGLYAFVE